MAYSAPDPGDARPAETAPEPDLTTAPAPAGPPSGAQPRNPLLAALGAGDAAVAAVARAFADAYSAAASRRETVQQRVADLPTELEDLRGRFSGEDLRRALESYRAQVERAYTAFAGRGEEAWERLREQPPVRQAITTLESYSGKLDSRVDHVVDDAQDAASRALAAAGRQTRATGERLAQAGQRFSGSAADAVVDVSATASDAVADAGTAAAGAIEDAGDETAAATRKATRKASGSGGSGRSTGKRAATPRSSPRRPGPTSG